MAKQTRAGEFADAALRIVARDGLDALSFRSVAAESGWSLGAVQKAFASKQELILGALNRSEEMVTASVGPPASPDLPTWLRNLLLQTLPLDEARRAAVIVGVAFADRAPFDPEIAAQIKGNSDATREQFARVIAWRRSEGEINPRLPNEIVAHLLLIFASGLAAELLYAPLPEDRVAELVAAAISALLAD